MKYRVKIRVANSGNNGFFPQRFVGVFPMGFWVYMKRDERNCKYGGYSEYDDAVIYIEMYKKSIKPFN